MQFYTNVYQYGSKMFVRGYDNGRPFKSKIEFYPTLYLTSKDENSEWRTLEGQPVEPINPGSIKESRDFVKRYEDVRGFEVHGNTNFVCQYISDNYTSEIQWDMDMVRVTSLDIETKTESGFPNITTANEEVLLITLMDAKTKRTVTFGTKPYDKKINNGEYHYYASERVMLQSFLTWWQENYPDVITGWNTNLFDIPYLTRRIINELGEQFAQKLSPWGLINERRITLKGNEEITYDIYGIAHADYLDLYKKFTYTKQESYKLDYIAEVELRENKKVNPGDTFKEFYMNHWDDFVEYNIHDVVLVDRLEDKMRLIELLLTMAYQAKINYEDVFSQVRMWDAIIYNHLRSKGIVIPQKSHSSKSEQFEGAYVKDPLIGKHKWVASFDLNSLYPHLIMQYNISPETLTHEKLSCTVDKLLVQEVDTSYAHKNNLSLTANGWCYRKDIKGFMPELMEKMYIDRSKFKKQMLAVQQQYEHDKTNNDLRKEISRLNNLQMAMKIALNSAYGAMGNQYFRYFDIRMAEGITTSGQLSIRWMANEFNRYMNKILKTQDKDYVIAIDTDSIYMTLENLVEQTCEGKTTEQKIKYMDKICEDIFQPFIDKTYENLAEYMNAFSQKMQMKREVLADQGLWCAKKRYILNVHNSEGVQYTVPKLKIMGLELVKSSTPAVIRGKLKDSIKVMFEGDQKDLHKFVSDFRKTFNALPPEEIAFPRGVNGMKIYAGSPIYGKGTPIAVRGALLFNHYVKKKGLDKRYQLIADGDKIKFIYVRKPNPFQEDVIAFPQELPSEFGLAQFINYDLQFEKTFLDPLQSMIQELGWTVEEKASLEEFFG